MLHSCMNRARKERHPSLWFGSARVCDEEARLPQKNGGLCFLHITCGAAADMEVLLFIIAILWCARR
jgi:hypothetical protein